MLLIILQPIITIALVATFLFGCPPKYEEPVNESPGVSSRSEHLVMENPGNAIDSVSYFSNY
jgi:hypothetical protein